MERLGFSVSLLGIAPMRVSVLERPAFGSDSCAVWQADVLDFRKAIRLEGLSLKILTSFTSSFLSHVYWSTTLGVAEWGMDVRARAVKMVLWIRGVRKGGLTAAEAKMAGLSVAT